MKDLRKNDKVIVVKVYEETISFYKAIVKSKGKKTITLEIEFPWFKEGERHYLYRMDLERYTTKIYDLNVDVNKVKEDLEKEFDRKFEIDDIINIEE